MKKTIVWLMAIMLSLTGFSAALATDDTQSSEASVSFNDDGTLSMHDPEAAESKLGLTFGNMDIPFGLNDVPIFAESYEAIARDGKSAYGVVVTDRRAEPTDWNLKVSFTGPFVNAAAAGADFNATITLSDGTAGASSAFTPTVSTPIVIDSSTQAAVTVMTSGGVGIGAFYSSWELADIVLQLGNDFGNIRAGDYAATLNWVVAYEVTP